MAIRRLSGPEPILTPADVPGDHDPADTKVTALIAAVQAGIDGPTGWLGRSLGEQDLEFTIGKLGRSIRLPYEPVRAIVSVKYRDADGAEQTIDAANYRLAGENRCLFGTGFSLPATDCAPDAVTVTYKAGYEHDDVPANAKQAVIIGVQQLKPMGNQNLFLRQEDVEGVGSTVYTVSDAATQAVKAATDMLLQPLRVYWL